jgi:hypothetical protein
MANYHISKNEMGMWRVMREGAERASGFANTQA